MTGVAEGQLERPVHVIGPREIESVAEAAERMRRALRQHADDEVIGAEREARLQESERIAVQLQETVVTRLFATGMAVLSVINRSPQLAGSLRGVVDELDAVGQELRTIALGLSGYATPSPVDLRRVVARAAEVARNDLGLAVHVRYDGPIDEVTNPNLVDEVASTLRDVLVELAESTVETVDVKVAALPSPVRDQVDAVRLGLTFEPSASLPNGLAAGRNDGPRWASELPDGRFGLEWDLGATDAGPVIEESRRDGRLT